jgi:hypothetical protein
VDRQRIESLLSAERISRYFHWGEPVATAANRVCVFPREDHWELIITDERAVPQEGTRRSFPDESSALEGALRSVRMFAEAMNYRAPSR